MKKKKLKALIAELEKDQNTEQVTLDKADKELMLFTITYKDGRQEQLKLKTEVFEAITISLLPAYLF